ncbi:hypothetical protein QRK86_24070 [Mycobacterium sp. FLAC0960]|nr:MULTISPECIES: hypothetical protein [Mycobacterium]MDM4143187.1 hypothetical protein [Mycobacterium sp. FLAC0960]
MVLRDGRLQDITTATRQGATIQFGGGPHPQDRYGTLDAIEQARRSQGPPRVVVRPNGDIS